MTHVRIVLTFLLLSIANPLAAEKAAAQRIESFAKKAMARIGTAPGLTVAVIKGDSVVYRGDFGLRDVEARLPVTPDTHFYMASSTKAFTAMTAAILAGEGTIDLDAPLSEVWPELKVTPPLDTKRLSLRDFLAMRSGVASDTINFRMEIGNLTDDRELLRLLEKYSREEPRTFRYSNAGYVLAGMILEKATGKRWFDLVQERILSPLNMTSTVAHPAPAATKVATCYRAGGAGAFIAIPAELPAIAGPAGGLVTTSADAAKWVMAMLHEGRTGGRQVLPRRAVRMAQSEQTAQKRRFRYYDRFAWGLGQDLGDYEGDLLVHRFGGLNGAYSHVSFMPDRGIGVVAFANGGGALPDAVASFAYDLLLGKPDLDAKWDAELTRIAESLAKDRDRRREGEAAMRNSRKDPGRSIEAYAGLYHYDRLGDITVTREGGQLFAQLGTRRAEMVPTGGDAFLADWAGEGQGSALTIVFESDRAVRLDWGGRIFDRMP